MRPSKIHLPLISIGITIIGIYNIAVISIFPISAQEGSEK